MVKNTSWRMGGQRQGSRMFLLMLSTYYGVLLLVTEDRGMSKTGEVFLSVEPVL